jgi:hypothetical protein
MITLVIWWFKLGQCAPEVSRYSAIDSDTQVATLLCHFGEVALIRGDSEF